MSEQRIEKINEIAQAFFEEQSDKDWIPAKALMPMLVDAGVFEKDVKKGMPLRKLLRALDKENQLSSMPLLHAERVENNTYWYFVREGAQFVSTETPKEETRKVKAKERIAQRDENYVLNLCDEILKLKSTRQHTFGFLKGDLHKNGVSRTKLPVDAYYHKLKLVLDYVNKSALVQKEDVDENRITVSGVSRAEQRDIYRKRKMKELKGNGILYIEIESTLFELGEDHKIIRDDEKNIEILTKLLSFNDSPR